MNTPNRLREHRERAGLRQDELAERLSALCDEPASIDGNTVSRHERGVVKPSKRYRRLYVRFFGVTEDELFSYRTDDSGADIEAVELLRRVEASDLSATTLETLESAFDDMARAYVRTSPKDLIPTVRTHLRYVTNLVDARGTLSQKRRLLVVGGWLSILSATLHTDVNQRASKAARDTAFGIGRDTEDRELQAWAFEVDAWTSLVNHDYRNAVSHAQAGSDLAPHGSPVAVQTAAQEARAWARLNDATNALSALRRASAELSQLHDPDRQQHHFTYDARKLEWYTGTVLAWLGDTESAEDTARDVIRRYEGTTDSPRRLITAWIDLALVIANRSPEEAANLGNLALTSGWLLPSNAWRVGELASMLVRQYPGVGGVRELRDRWLLFVATHE